MPGSYANITDWVKKNYGYVPQTCWIAHVKELCGLIIKPSWNRIGEERKKPCPPERIADIKAALKHFNLI